MPFYNKFRGVYNKINLNTIILIYYYYTLLIV